MNEYNKVKSTHTSVLVILSVRIFGISVLILFMLWKPALWLLFAFVGIIVIKSFLDIDFLFIVITLLDFSGISVIIMLLSRVLKQNSTKNGNELNKSIPAQVICPHCKTLNSSRTKICKKCQKEIPFQTMTNFALQNDILSIL